MYKKDQTEGRILKPTSPTAPPGAGTALMLFPISALTFQRYAGEVALYLNAPADTSSTLNHLPRFRFNTLGDFNGPLARSDAFGSTAHASCSRPLSERCAWGRQVKHDWIHSRRDCRVTVFRVQLLFSFFSASRCLHRLIVSLTQQLHSFVFTDDWNSCVFVSCGYIAPHLVAKVRYFFGVDWIFLQLSFPLCCGMNLFIGDFPISQNSLFTICL